MGGGGSESRFWPPPSLPFYSCIVFFSIFLAFFDFPKFSSVNCRSTDNRKPPATKHGLTTFPSCRSSCSRWEIVISASTLAARTDLVVRFVNVQLLFRNVIDISRDHVGFRGLGSFERGCFTLLQMARVPRTATVSRAYEEQLSATWLRLLRSYLYASNKPWSW